MSYYYLQTSNDHLAHHGILGMKWGIRRYQPYPKGHKGGKEVGEAAKVSVKKRRVSKHATRYMIQDKKKNVLSEATMQDWKMKGVDWNLLTNVKTRQDQRGKGFASVILNKAYDDAQKKGKSTYLFVSETNNVAINLYKKLGFEFIEKTILNNDAPYLVLGKGSADKGQLEDTE